MDDATLARPLAALASPTRLALLRALRTPRTLSEIEVGPEGREGRHIARQVVAKHLDRLREAGLVARREVARDGRDAAEYLVDHQAVFSLAEEVRALARLRPAVEPPSTTAPRAASDLAAAKGPALILVHGLDEGAAFPLPRDAPTREWTIGRRRGSDVPLDFDPSVSARHASIRLEGSAHVARDLGSRNGTTVNFRRLAAGEPRALRHGDLLGAGRCLLLYWA